MRTWTKSVAMVLGAVALWGCGAPEAGAGDEAAEVIVVQEAGIDEAGADPQKQDWFGNRGTGEPCSWDWMCRSDDGLICRPREGEGGVKWRCAGPGQLDALCYDQDDCASGRTCFGADYVPAQTHEEYQCGIVVWSTDDDGNLVRSIGCDWVTVTDTAALKIIGRCK